MLEVIYHIAPAADLDEAWQALEDSGCRLLYSEQDDAAQQIIGYLPPASGTAQLLAKHSFIQSIVNAPLPSIDWDAQWAAHGLNYRDGMLHIDMQDFAPGCLLTHMPSGQWPSVLKLKPGPGFGDLSHATTRLVLKLMHGRMAGQAVIDVGCGSGILALAALSLGAASVCGIDIEAAALVHAEANCRLNGMQGHISFGQPADCRALVPTTKPLVILMNMIHSEQRQAWQSLAAMHGQVGLAITSGILREQEAEYLKGCATWGWRLLAKMEEEGWLGFVFGCSAL